MKLILYFLLFTFCLASASNLQAARYSVKTLNLLEANAINQQGKIIGKSAGEDAIVWPPDEDNTNSYSESNMITLPVPSPTPLSISATDINDANQDAEGEIIVGWYEDADTNQKQAIYWTREANSYKLNKLPLFNRTTSRCAGDAEPTKNLEYPSCYNESNYQSLIEHASSCDNSSFDISVSTAIITIECDIGSIAVGVNNNQYIIGSSFRQDNTERAVVWLKQEITQEAEDEETQNVFVLETDYIAIDLATTPIISKVERCETYTNPNASFINPVCFDDSNYQNLLSNSSCDNKNFDISKDASTINIGCSPLSSVANSLYIAKNVNIVVGTICDVGDCENGDGEYHYYVWPSVLPAELPPPLELKKIIDKIRIVERCDGKKKKLNESLTHPNCFDETNYQSLINNTNCDNSKFDINIKSSTIIFECNLEDDTTENTQLKAVDVLSSINVEHRITSISNNDITGWYTDTNNNPLPVIWTVNTGSDTTEASVKSRVLSSLNTDGYGRIMHKNGAEIIGSSGTASDNFIAIYSTFSCGIQNLNDLLAKPQIANALLLSNAEKIAQATIPNKIIASGTENSVQNNFLLAPVPVDVDLEIALSASVSELTVGDKNTYTLTVTNNSIGDDENSGLYATCLTIHMQSEIVINERGTRRPGGISFLEINPTAGITCTQTPIDVSCKVSRINPGDSAVVSILSEPRALLADRAIRMTATITASETDSNTENNRAILDTFVKRENCFIATAAYGSHFAPQVKTLRHFRDNVLLTNTPGKALVHLYYEYSPPIAQFIKKRDYLKAGVRGILTPITLMIKHPTLSLIILLVGLLGIIKTINMRKKAIKTCC